MRYFVRWRSIMDGNDELTLITDIGSTTTKGLLLREISGRFEFVEQYETPTTVEKPDEDVRVGLRTLVGEIEKRTGTSLGLDGNRIGTPYLTTSSAGGGLQILVFGLSSVETGTVAEMTAYGAGGVVLKTFTVDDRISPVNKMRIMQELHPDMILMAGGIDGGAIAPIVELAEILSLAKPTPKFRVGEKIPLVFCGNIEARSFVENLLAENFEVHTVDNVRPDMDTLNTEPAKQEIHRLFMDNVMERAPGYSDLKAIVARDILPTPAGVERILTKFAEKRERNIAMVDIGGATTDIFTVIKGVHSRTVSANIGMSYSLSNILADAGIERIASRIEGLNTDDVRNYIANKTLNPIHVPGSVEERIVEYSCAVEGIRIAWELHRDMNFRVAKVGFLDRRKKWLKNANRWEQVLYLHKKEESFQLSDIDLIIAAGGVVSHMEPDTALPLVAEAFLPSGITEVAIDKYFKSPHMGVFSTVEPEKAVELFYKECLRFLGHIVAPIGKIKEGKIALTVENLYTGEKIEIPGGETRILKEGGNFKFTCGRRLTFGADDSIAELKTERPIVLDCRGRGNYFIGGNLTRFSSETGAIPKIAPPSRESEVGEFEIIRKLPYEGDILVEVGDEVRPTDVVAENRFGPPRLYILDMNRILGYEKSLSSGEIIEGLMVSEDDTVKIGQRIFQTHHGILGTKIYTSSPIRGKITKIEDSGIIILREIQDYDGRPRKVNIAKELDIKPKYVPGHFKYNIGDFVEKGQVIASDVKQGIIVQSPTTGTVKEIDKTRGTVTIQYDIEPTPLFAFAKGYISSIKPGYEVRIKTNAVKLFGSVGFGGESSGELFTIEAPSEIGETARGKIVACTSAINEKFLYKCADIGVAGVIAPSIPNYDWVNFHGKEMGVAVTGDEKIPFPVIITEGFGDYAMAEIYSGFLMKSNGKTVSLSGRTQIRAGVIRPVALIYND